MKVRYTSELVSVYRPALDIVEVRDKKSGAVVAQFLVESIVDTLPYNRSVSDMIGLITERNHIMETMFTAKVIKINQPDITEEGQKFFDTVEVRDKNTGVVVDRVWVESCEDTEPYNLAVEGVVGKYSFEWIE